jgi:succinate-acetate transporter protein
MRDVQGPRLVALTFVLVALVLSGTAASVLVAGGPLGLVVSLGLFAAWAGFVGVLLASTPTTALRPVPVSAPRGPTAYPR